MGGLYADSSRGESLRQASGTGFRCNHGIHSPAEQGGEVQRAQQTGSIGAGPGSVWIRESRAARLEELARFGPRFVVHESGCRGARTCTQCPFLGMS